MTDAQLPLPLIELSDLVAERVKDLRKRGGWRTAKDFAKRCAEVGAPQLTAPALMNIESGRRKNGRRTRSISVDELFALAMALDVSPLVLLLPEEPGEYAVTPTIRTSMAEVYLWIIGQRSSPHRPTGLMPAEEEQLARLLFRKALPWAAPPDADSLEWLRDPQGTAEKLVQRFYANLPEDAHERMLAAIPMKINRDGEHQPNPPADIDTDE